MGRPRKPTALKILDGDRKDRIIADEPTAPPGIGEVPTWLDRFGREAWERFSAHHKMSRLLTVLDVEAATLYCQAYSMYRHALATITEDIAAEPAEAWAKPHPMYKVANEAHRQMTRILSKFGMTPSDRAGLHMQAAPEDDPLLKLLASRRAANGGGKR